jgi:hypothetical protein
MSDVELSSPETSTAASQSKSFPLVWNVLTNERHAKLIVSKGGGDVVVVSQTDTQALYVDVGQTTADNAGLRKIEGSFAKFASLPLELALQIQNPFQFLGRGTTSACTLTAA